MTYQSTHATDAENTLPKLPVWVTTGRVETLETVAFRSGCALTVLDTLRKDPRFGVPDALLVNKRALSAATATSKIEGRFAHEADIRDAYHLTPAGLAHGPDGDLLAFWRRAAGTTVRDRQTALAALLEPTLWAAGQGWLAQASARAATHGPLAGCAMVMRAVVQADDRAERAACLLSDVVLAQALGWQKLLPISAECITKPALRALAAEGQGAELRVQSCLLTSVERAIHLARDLSRRGAALRAVAPKLRAKGSDAAVALFLTEDTIAPAALRGQGPHLRMTDRAARRFCDRLVTLNVAQELTGRSTFRLYGLAP